MHDGCLVRSVLAQWLSREPDLRVDDVPWRRASCHVRALRPDVCAADLDYSDTAGIPPLGGVWGRARRRPAYSYLPLRTGLAC